jgi:hypothetical protein
MSDFAYVDIMEEYDLWSGFSRYHVVRYSTIPYTGWGCRLYMLCWSVQDLHRRHTTCGATYGATCKATSVIWELCLLIWPCRPKRRNSRHRCNFFATCDATGSTVSLSHAICTDAVMMACDEETSVKQVQLVENFVYLHDYSHEYYANSKMEAAWRKI